MSHSILLVDDDSALRAMLDVMLTRAGYTTFQVEDGQQALEFIEMEMPDLFIVDIMMPGMSGFEVCKALRAKPETAQHPVILLSALTDSQSKAQGIAVGADLYLSKPVSSRELVPHIENLLKKDGQT